MKPHGVIKRSRLDISVEHAFAMGHQRRIQKRHIRRIGENSQMDRRIIWKRPGGTKPDMLHRIPIWITRAFGAEIAFEIHWPKLDGPVTQKIALDVLRQFLPESCDHVFF